MRRVMRLMVVAVLLVGCGEVWGLELREGYRGEVWGSYECSLSSWHSMAFGGDGDLYVLQTGAMVWGEPYSPMVVRVGEGAEQAEVMTDLVPGLSRHICWGGGDFGEYLYVSGGGVFRMDLAGNVSEWETQVGGLGGLAIDAAAGEMYGWSSEGIMRGGADGSAELFAGVTYPGRPVGGPLACDTRGGFAGRVYGAGSVEGLPGKLIEFRDDGSYGEFSAVAGVRDVAFDRDGRYFGGDLFALAMDDNFNYAIYGIGANGEYRLVASDASGLMTFGPDGALYVAQAIDKERPGEWRIEVVRIVPEPGGVLLMGVVFGGIWRRRLQGERCLDSGVVVS